MGDAQSLASVELPQSSRTLRPLEKVKWPHGSSQFTLNPGLIHLSRFKATLLFCRVRRPHRVLVTL